MTRFGVSENGHVPAHLALQTVTAETAEASTPSLLELLGQARAEHGRPVELRARLDGDPDADLVWEPVPPGEEFPWVFADRDSKVPNSPAPTWTTSPPTELGWYWARWESPACGQTILGCTIRPSWSIVLVKRLFRCSRPRRPGDPPAPLLAWNGEKWWPLSRYSGWAGPLEPPEEP